MKAIPIILCSLVISLICGGCAVGKVGRRVEKAKDIVKECWVKDPFIEPVASGSSFNPNNALTLARVCRLVWETDRINIQKVSSQWNARYLFADLPDTHSQYLIFGNHNYTVVSFRATQSKLGDIWTVLKYQEYEDNPEYKAKKIYEDLPRGNAGFREGAADCFASGLVEDLNNFRSGTGAEKSPLFVTGHSLGGGIALLVRQKLEAAGINVDSVYVFGCPVAVSGKLTRDSKYKETEASIYKSKFGSTTFFHRYEGDNVPLLRPTNKMYSPPGWSRQLTANGAMSEYQEYRTMNIFTGGAWCIPWLTGMIHNHNLERSYIPALKKGVKETQF
ncbi:MAG: lipase family protein [Verrucomicrobiota bacterium]